jgi:hypothetical protein
MGNVDTNKYLVVRRDRSHFVKKNTERGFVKHLADPAK